MKKLIVLLMSFGLVFSVYATDQWDTTDPAGSESPSDLDSLITTNNDVVDRLLSDYRQGAKISYSSATTLSVSSGQVTCDNSGRTLRKWRENTSATSVTFSSIDTSTEAASTTYYVYAVADTDATTFTIVISKSSTEPSGATYYAKLGQFYNDASSNIVNDNTIVNDNETAAKQLGDWVAKSNNVSYLASSDGGVCCYLNVRDTGGSQYNVFGYTDSSNPPTIIRGACTFQYTPESPRTNYHSFSMPVKKGDYYKVSGSGSGTVNNLNIYWIPNN